MDQQDFSIGGNFDGMSNDYNSSYRSCDLSDHRSSVNRGFKEGESSTLDPTNELDESQERLSADGVEENVEHFFATHAVNSSPLRNREQAIPYESSTQFQEICGERQGTPYTYNRYGELEGNAGYGKEIIELYLCNHHFYRGKSNFKNCGLMLWIQRAPPITDSYGATLALCLYKDCQVDQNRHIQAGDIRIAFDEKSALGLENNPRINAGYVHLKCLEAHISYHRQMFAKLNFKVEGRGPRKNDPWLRNPTIFTTISQILYAEDYIEGCSKGRMDGGGNSDAILLSAGLEKELRGAHPVLREVERKILEMEGWDDLKALVDLKYAQACSTAPRGNKIVSPQKPRVREGYLRKKDHRSRKAILAAEGAIKQAGRHSRYESPSSEESRPRSSKHSKRRYKKRDLPPRRIESEVTTEPQPLKKGEGKVKSRMFIRDGEEIWEKYEDPWSPLVSDIEMGGIEGDEASRYEEDLREEEDLRDDENSGDDEASSDDEPRGHKRMRSDDEDNSEGNEPPIRDDKRKRAY